MQVASFKLDYNHGRRAGALSEQVQTHSGIKVFRLCVAYRGAQSWSCIPCCCLRLVKRALYCSVMTSALLSDADEIFMS